jgi:hypothetical protein
LQDAQAFAGFHGARILREQAGKFAVLARRIRFQAENRVVQCGEQPPGLGIVATQLERLAERNDGGVVVVRRDRGLGERDMRAGEVGRERDGLRETARGGVRVLSFQ